MPVGRVASLKSKDTLTMAGSVSLGLQDKLKREVVIFSGVR